MRLQVRLPEHDCIAFVVNASTTGPASQLRVFPGGQIDMAVAIPLRKPFDHNGPGWHVDAERQRLYDLTIDCLRAGAYGISLSFVDSDSKGRRVPSRLASAEEYRDLAIAIKEVGYGLLQYVPRFMRAESYIKDIDRVDQMCQGLGVPHTYAPLVAGKRSREMAEEVLAHTRAVRAAGSSLWPQVSPRSMPGCSASFTRPSTRQCASKVLGLTIFPTS